MKVLTPWFQHKSSNHSNNTYIQYCAEFPQTDTKYLRLTNHKLSCKVKLAVVPWEEFSQVHRWPYSPVFKFDKPSPEMKTSNIENSWVWEIKQRNCSVASCNCKMHGDDPNRLCFEERICVVPNLTIFRVMLISNRAQVKLSTWELFYQTES